MFATHRFLVTPSLLLSLLAFSCTDDVSSVDDVDLYPEDRVELADESIADDVEGTPPQTTAICIGPPQGKITRMFVDANGRVRAQGAVWSDIANCPTSVLIRLRRDGVRIDSQYKHCSAPGCTSRLLSAGNPAGSQTFCATVRASEFGSVLDRKCFTR